MTSEWMVASWIVGIVSLSVMVLWINERLRRSARFEGWLVPPVLVIGCVLSYFIGLALVISHGGTIKELLLYPLVIPGVILWVCAVMVVPLWADIFAVVFETVDSAIKRLLKRS